jgi:DNA-binding NtrC family response regulator
VRELRNAVTRYLALHDDGSAQDTSSPPCGVGSNVSATEGLAQLVDELLDANMPFPRARDRVLDRFTELYVARVLSLHGGDVARAASASGIGRRYFEKLRARTTG